jgi:ubiquitin related modifier 1
MINRGGLEMLFSNQRVHQLEIPAKTSAKSIPTIAWLIDYLCEKKLKDPRKDLFVLDDTVYAAQHFRPLCGSGANCDTGDLAF